MTKKEMHDQVVSWLGLQDIVAYNESDLVDLQLFNGTVDLLGRTRCTARCVNLQTQANVDTYQLDQAIICLVDVENGATRRTRRDQSQYWPAFTLIRSDVLRVEPPPSEPSEVQTWAVLRPQPLVNDGDSPSDEPHGAIPAEFHDAIVTYALWHCADYGDDASSSNGERYRMLYEGQDGRGGRLAQIRAAVNKRGTVRAPSRRVRLRGVNSHGSFVS